MRNRSRRGNKKTSNSSFAQKLERSETQVYSQGLFYSFFFPLLSSCVSPSQPIAIRVVRLFVALLYSLLMKIDVTLYLILHQFFFETNES